MVSLKGESSAFKKTKPFRRESMGVKEDDELENFNPSTRSLPSLAQDGSKDGERSRTITKKIQNLSPIC